MGGIDRHPAAIVRVADAHDVAQAIATAREAGLELAVRSGGHSNAGHSVSEGGIVLDLHDMKAADFDLDAGTVWAETGLTAGELTTAAAEHGVAVGFGDTGSVGIGGITLGGGVGYLGRKFGLTIDSLLAADVVTADGQVLRASQDEHPDLFWALRGGGGNFGVVTSFEFRLHSVGPAILAGPIVWDAADAADLLRFYRDFIREAPDDLGTVVRFGAAPPISDIPADLHWRPVVIVGTCYAGPIEDGDRVLRPLRAFGTPLLDQVAPTPYVQFQSALDSTVLHGWN